MLTLATLARSQDFYYKPFPEVSASVLRPVRSNPPPPSEPYPTQPYHAPNYNFQWQVLDTYSGNDYGHKESREDKVTTGSYHVALPDGRVQRVTYSVDGYGGYKAEVTYEGEPKYEPYEPKPYVPKPKPSYPVQPYSQASETRPAYVQTAAPEAKAAEPVTTPAPAPKEPEAVAKTVVQSISPAPKAIRK